MGRQPDPWPSLLARIEKIETQLRRQGNASPFFGTGLHPTADGGMTVDGQMAGSGWDGDLAAGNVGTTGWALNATRAALPELLLRPGSIGNDTLANPLAGSAPNVSASGFSLAQNVLTELAGVDVTVPDGFTRVFAVAAATVFAYNPRTTGGSNGQGGDALYARVRFAGQMSHANPVGVSGLGGYATSFSNAGFELSGLTPGGTVRLSVDGTAAYQTLAANPDNYANANAALFWLR